MAIGSATLDFGATPSDLATVVVTGQTGILTGSSCEAWFMSSTTGAHGPGEHEMLAAEAVPVCGSIVAATSFTITINTPTRWIGAFTVQWAWF